MDVYTSSPTLNPYVGETVVIYYKLESQANLTLNIYNDNNTLVRTMVTNELRESGFQTETWDGKDNSGLVVPDGFYYFTKTCNVDGQMVWQYDPSHTDGTDISKTLVLSISKFDAKNNVMCTLDLDIPELVYIYTRIRPGRWAHDDSDTIRLLKYHEPFAGGHAQFYWDGRDESGDLVPHGSYFIGVWGYRPNINSIMVIGGTPRISVNRNCITPVRIRPYDNPYRADTSAPEASIAFELSRDAFVTAKVYNDSGILVNSLLEDESLVAGNQVVRWDARASDGKQLPKGYYRVMIQAHYGENYSEPVILHVELVW
jgi:flagellar hook assembly protein FlgD